MFMASKGNGLDDAAGAKTKFSTADGALVLRTRPRAVQCSKRRAQENGFLPMPETGSANIEVAQHFSRREAPTQSGAYEMLEIIEALVLAVVAIATAWSG